MQRFADGLLESDCELVESEAGAGTYLFVKKKFEITDIAGGNLANPLLAGITLALN